MKYNGDDDMSVFSEEDKIKILADIVEINTENDNELEVCNYFKALLNKYDIDSKIIKVDNRRANLVAEIGEGKPKIAISGHMDVVDAGDYNEWKYDPFKLNEEDDKLYGRGTTDMKGGLAALIIAMIEIKESGHLQKGTIRLMATAAEEKEMSGAQLFKEQGYVDDLDGMIIAEPSDGFAFYATKGSMGLKVTSKGIPAHTSLPSLGHNAINSLIAFIQRIKEKYVEIKKNEKDHSLDVHPYIDECIREQNHYSDGDLKEDVAAGLVIVNSIIRGGEQFNTVPESAYAEFNIRTVPEYDNVAIEKLFKDTVKEIDSERLSVEVTVNHTTVYTHKDNRLINTFLEYNHDFKVSGMVGATDAAELLGDKDEDFDLAIIGPGHITLAHQTDEYVYKSRYLDYIDMYQQVILNYLNQH